MNLPNPQALEDGALQLSTAADRLGPLVEVLEKRCATAPTDPAHRERWEQNVALLTALKIYFAAVDNLLALQGQHVSEMREEMTAAQLRYDELNVANNYLKTEAQQYNQRYYDALDVIANLQAQFPQQYAAAA